MLDYTDVVREMSAYYDSLTEPLATGWLLVCPDRIHGEAKAYLGDLEGARDEYHKALEEAQQFRFRPEIAQYASTSLNYCWSTTRASTTPPSSTWTSPSPS